MKKEEHFRIYIAAYLVLEKDGRILLLRRANTGYQDGKYSLIAGHLDGNEKAKDCIIREAKEEANIEILPEDLTVVHVMHRYSSDREYIDIYLTAGKWSNELKNMEPNKCDDLSWFSVSNLPDTVLPDVKFVLENIKNKNFYGEFGW